MNKRVFKQYQFKFKPLATLFFLLIFVLLILLSFWQLQRAKAKQQLLQQYELSAKEPIHQISSLAELKKALPYQRVRISGHYDNKHQFLLDNRFYNHQAGYEVLTPLVIGKEIVMVNRGWIPRLSSRQNLPVLSEVKTVQTIEGRIIQVNEKPFLLGAAEENPTQWPRLLQGVDFVALGRALEVPVPTVILQLAPDQPNGFVRKWQPVVMKPEKHIAYAVQWFLLALVQLIVIMRYNLQRI